MTFNATLYIFRTHFLNNIQTEIYTDYMLLLSFIHILNQASKTVDVNCALNLIYLGI